MKRYVSNYSRSVSGYSLKSKVNVNIQAGGRELIPTGVKVAIPEGYIGTINQPIGLTYMNKLRIEPEIIDANHRWEIKVLVHNYGEFDKDVKFGDIVGNVNIVQSVYTGDYVSLDF